MNNISQELEHAVLAFCFGYKDEFGRTWRDIKNPSHTNGVFWRDIVRDLCGKGLVTLVEVWPGREVVEGASDLKFVIKRVYAKLRRGEPFGTLEEMVDFYVAHRDTYKLFVGVNFSAEDVILRRLDGELVAAMRDERAGSLAVETLREKVGTT